MLVLANRSIANADIGLAFDHGSDDFGDIAAFILAVSIGVHDDVGPFHERSIYSTAERFSQSTIPAVANDVMHSPATRDTGSVVRASVIDDQILNGINAFDRSWQPCERLRQELGFIQARNLYDQLGHCAPIVPPRVQIALGQSVVP